MMKRLFGLSTLVLGCLAACTDDNPERINGPASTGVPIACFRNEIYCGGTCTDTQTSTLHCGACGKACATGVACIDGACASTPSVCPAPTSVCTQGDAVSCVNLKNDTSNCGSCNNTCSAGQVCSAASCGNTCTAPDTKCPGNGKPFCADLDNDSANCGMCGTRCSGGRVCSERTCKVPLFTSSPALASGGNSCTTMASNSGRKVAIASDHSIYVAMRCGAQVYVARSGDGGVTFGQKVDTSIDGQGLGALQSDASIAVSATGEVYVVATKTTGELVFTRSVDQGATWSFPAQLEGAMDGSWGAHVAVKGSNVFVSGKKAATDQTHLHRNGSFGVGSFDVTMIAMNGNNSGDVVADLTSGSLWAVSDDGGLRLRRSTDNGVSFLPAANPSPAGGSVSWAAAGGNIFAAASGGAFNSLWVFPSANPQTSQSIPGIAMSPTAGSRSVTADALGNAYSAATLANGGIQIDRVTRGTTTIASSRVIDTGSYPSVAAIAGDAAAVAFTKGTSVYVSVQKY